MNEAETRAEQIDRALQAAGWGVVEASHVRREYSIAPGRIEGHGRRGKSLKADYVLEYRNTKLAVIEAKGSTHQATTKAQIRKFTVEFSAPLEEQKGNVGNIDAMLAESQRLANIYSRKLAALAALKKSLLHQAFSGEL